MRHKSIKIFLIFMFVFTTININGARAAPLVEQSMSSVVTKLQGLEKTLNNTYSGQEGLYYNLYYLTLKVQWTNFLYDFQNSIGLDFTKSEKTIYWQELVNDIKKFNTTFGQSSGVNSVDATKSFTPLKLSIYENEKNYIDMAKDYTAVKVPTYLKSVLDKVLSEYSASPNDEEKKIVITNYKTDLRYVYRLLNALLQEPEQMEYLLPVDGVLYVPGSPKAAEIWSNTNYQTLLNKGREFDMQETDSLSGIEEVPSNIYLERLSYVTRKTISGNSNSSDLGYENWAPIVGSSTSGTDYKLRDSYIRMFSASAVYRPLISYVGDDDFLQALGSLFPDEDTKKSMLQLYQEVKDYRKPLYSIHDTSHWYDSVVPDSTTSEAIESSIQTYSGKANLLTLQSFMKSVEDENLNGLVMHKGKLGVSEKDVNSYSYFNDNPRFDTPEESAAYSSNNYSQVVDTTPEPTSEPEVGSTPSSSEGSEDSSTVGQSPQATPAPKIHNSILDMATDELSTVYWTSTVLESGGRSNAMKAYPIAGTTLATLRNYFKDLNFIDSVSSKMNSYLFMNAFGDIVTQDNLVVVPGASNPIFYNQELGYFPYNVMFMKGYPTIYERNQDLVMGAKTDKGKYLLMSGGDEYGKSSTMVKIKGDNNIATTDPLGSYWISLKLAEDIGGEVPFKITELGPTYGKNIKNLWSIMKFSIGYMKNSDAYNSVGVVEKRDLIIDGASMNQYDPAVDTDYKLAKYIARNVYYSFSKTNVGSSGNGRLREDFLFKNVLVEAMNGTIYTAGYSKALTETMDYINEDSYWWFTNIMYKAGQKVLSNMGKVDGVLGVKRGYQDGLFSSIIYYIDKFLWYIILVIVVGFIFQYMRNGSTFLYTVTIGGLVVAVAYVFLKIVPIYLPTAYNFISNNTNRSLSYQVMYTKTEKYFETYSKSNTTDDEGNFKISTTSLDLYRLGSKQLEDVINQFNLPKDSLTKGKMYVLDGNSGVYLQGDRLKVNVDTLLATNPITGSYEDTEYGSAYQLQSSKMFSSVMDYYTPYYLLEDGFVDTLNRLLLMYNIPRYSISYGDGLNKDSYIVYNYTNSPPFLNPGEYTQEDGILTAEQVEKLYLLFDDTESKRSSVDFLNLHSLLSNSTPEMENSLWYRTMIQNGIDPKSDDPVVIKRYNDLISSVNMLTKKFIIDLNNQAGLISDENMIKVISMYATTIFDQKVSATWKNNVYPKSMNYEEFKLDDVFLSVFTEDYSRFLNNNRDVVYYMRDRLDIISFTVFILTIALVAIVSVGLQFSLPALYLALGVIIAIKLIFGSRFNETIKGYFKISVILFSCLTVLVTVLGLRAGKNSTASVWIIFIVSLVILAFMLMILVAVLMEPTNLGSSKINAAFGKLAKLPLIRSAVNKLIARTSKIDKTTAQQEFIRDHQRRYSIGANRNEYLEQEAPDLSNLERAVNNSIVKRSRKVYLFEADQRLRNKIANKGVDKDFEDIM